MVLPLSCKRAGEDARHLETKHSAPPAISEPSVLIPPRPARLGESSSRKAEEHELAVGELVQAAKEDAVLEPDQARDLLAFIAGPKPATLTDREWEERVNVTLNLLRAQPDVLGLADTLLRMGEFDGNVVLRLYAMQHLALWYGREKSTEKKEEIISLFERLARDGGETAGSAVQFLADIRRMNPNALTSDGTLASPEAVRLAGDDSAANGIRISAILTCVDTRDAAVLPVARRIVVDESRVIPLRKAAIHSLGVLGAVEDGALLERLQGDPDLKPAAEPALKMWQERVGEPGE